MAKTKILTLKRDLITSVAIFTTLLAIGIFAPLIKNQLITGSIVNATLFVGTVLFGVQNAILLGFGPSLIALFFGLLPIPLFPMVPFIMVANTILVCVFSALKDKNYWFGVLVASVLKFVFLSVTSFAILNLFLKKETASKIITMMTWPQLFTALAGGIITFFFLKSLKKLN
jgi:hypothetical protein